MFKRYLIVFLVVLSMITGGTIPAFASTPTNVKVTMPAFQVFVNNSAIDNAHSLYPLLLYKDITYFPMTWNYTRALGLSTTWDSTTKTLGIEKSKNQEMVKQDLTDNPNKDNMYEAVVSNFPLNVNGKTIDNAKEEYPILFFRNITYFPMTWKFTHDEFQWQTSWDSVKGFQITTNANPSNQTDTDNLNLLNGGQLASDGEWIYYNPNNSWYGQNYLYKTKVDGSEKQKLSDDNAISINVSGDWIYYVLRDQQEGNKGIYRIRKDGTQRTKLSDSAVQQITVDDNWIYFVDNKLDKTSGSNVNYQPVGIKRMKRDGTNETLIHSGSVSPDLHLLKDTIYFRQNDRSNSHEPDIYLYKMQKDGTQLTKISDQGLGPSFMIIDDWIYYSLDKTVYKMSLDGSQIIPFYTSDDYISYPQHYHDGWIYFKQGTFGIIGSANIKRVRIDGADASPFVEKVRPSAFYFVDSTFYFTNAWEGNAELNQVGADGQIIYLKEQ